MPSKTKPPRGKFPVGFSIATFALLFTFAIPWWWQYFPQQGSRVVFGAPLWFVTAAFGSLLISIVTVRALSVAWKAFDGASDE